jgi:large subunit ribosomal protein L18
MKLDQKRNLRQKRVWRIRKKVRGTAERPRLCVHFSNKHINAQAIDDVTGKTVFSLTTMSKEIKDEKLTANRAGAEKLGELFGTKAKEAGIKAVVFDRNGRPYHGTVKTFAEAARKAGLEF